MEDNKDYLHEYYEEEFETHDGRKKACKCKHCRAAKRSASTSYRRAEKRRSNKLLRQGKNYTHYWA